MCQASIRRSVVSNNIASLRKPVLKVSESPTEEFGAYGDYWGMDSMPPPQGNLTNSASMASFKSVDSTTNFSSYGSYWGTEMEE